MNMMLVQNFEVMCDKYRQIVRNSSKIMVLMTGNIYSSK
jgi:hypothetical protein